MLSSKLFLFSLLLTGPVALGQEQEKRMEERILGKPDQNKVFDMRQSAFGGKRSFAAGEAKVAKEFYTPQKFESKGFLTRWFSGSKNASVGDVKFSTKAANTAGKYAAADLAKIAPTKSAATKDARESEQTMEVRTLADGSRQYLGKESKKLRTPVDPREAADWRGAEGMVTSGGEMGQGKAGRTWVSPLERGGQLKEMTIEDVREVLNKNK